jgi:hypothetical protein
MYAIVLLLLCVINLQAQDVFHVGFMAGVNTSQVHGDNFSGFDKAGLVAGGFAKQQLNEKWDIKFEILYSQKGSRDLAHPDKDDYISYLLRLNYAEVPLVFRRSYKKWVLELGMSEAFLVYYEEHDANGRIDQPKPFKKLETNLVTGFAYKWKENIEFNVRYTNSVMPVRKFESKVYYASRFYNLFNRGLYNNVLSFTAYYQLGGKKNEQ